MLSSKIQAEWESILRTDAWKLFVTAIKKHRDVLSGDCENKDDPRREQGGVKAIDFILGRDYLYGRSDVPGLVTRIIEETKQKSE
jgi:hypothetical protein